MAREDDILKLTKQLFPTGRAFRIAKNSTLRKVLYALGISEAQAIDDSLTILDQILPDNDNFTEEDAALWEKRLGLKIANPLLTLEERKTLIARKYAFPGRFIYRQNWRFLEYQLRLSGFDVYVHENRFLNGSYSYDVPEMGITQHADETEHGYDTEMGDDGLDIVANSKYSPEFFDIGDETNFKGAFFVGGEIYDDEAVVSPALETELRKLICVLKPANTFAILLINYQYTGALSFMSGDPFLLMTGTALFLVFEA